MNQQKYIVIQNGGPFCIVCRKVATEAHVASGAHMLKMEEEAISNSMGGDAKSLRRFEKDVLCQGPATKKLIFEFWGDAIQNLPQVSREIHEKKKCFYINSKMDRAIKPKDAIHELAIVSYSGGGKYNSSTYIPWHDLPDQVETADESQLKRTPPEGQGWWPVIALRKETERYQGKEVCKVLLVCFYQLQSDGPVPAWWIYPEAEEMDEPMQSGYPNDDVDWPPAGHEQDDDEGLKGVWADMGDD